MNFNPSLAAGKLLGFYEAGDQILAWINALDSSEMTTKQLRGALVKKILDMRPENLYNGSRTVTDPEENSLRAIGARP